MKHNYYRKVNEKFESFNEWTRNEVQKVKELEDRIIEFKDEQEAIITRSFREMISKIVTIDGNKPVLVNAGDENPEEFKEGQVNEKSALTFLMKENCVMSLDLMSQRLIEIERLNETYSAKLLPITNKSLLVVGG